MGGYEYLNARVRAMSRFLLPNDVYDQILAAENEDILIDVLLDSPYGEVLAARLPEQGSRAEHGLVSAEFALREGLSDTFARMKAFATEGPRQLIGIQLNRWDLYNVIALIRGKIQHAPVEEMERSFVPAGEFHPVQLAELARERDVRSLADALTTWGYRFGSEVRRAILEFQDDLQALETTLYARYFTWALGRLTTSDSNEAILRNLLQMQVDVINVVSVLKQAAFRADAGAARRAGGNTGGTAGKRNMEIAKIPGGKIQAKILDEATAAPNVEYALEVLDQTYFAPAVERGILLYGQTNRFSVLERFFDMIVIEKGVRLFRNDPLSLAVSLGYIWRKVNEYFNLRMLLRGRRYRLPPNTIREELIFV